MGNAPAAAEGSIPGDQVPWYARPPRQHLRALIAVGALLAVWLCYLFWLAMVSLPQRSAP